jgi:hypothetical protein
MPIAPSNPFKGRHFRGEVIGMDFYRTRLRSNTSQWNPIQFQPEGFRTVDRPRASEPKGVYGR